MRNIQGCDSERRDKRNKIRIMKNCKKCNSELVGGSITVESSGVKYIEYTCPICGAKTYEVVH